MILQRLAKYDFHEMTLARWFMQKTDNRALSSKYCRTLSNANRMPNGCQIVSWQTRGRFGTQPDANQDATVETHGTVGTQLDATVSVFFKDFRRKGENISPLTRGKKT